MDNLQGNDVNIRIFLIFGLCEFELGQYSDQCLDLVPNIRNANMYTSDFFHDPDSVY